MKRFLPWALVAILVVALVGSLGESEPPRAQTERAATPAPSAAPSTPVRQTASSEPRRKRKAPSKRRAKRASSGLVGCDANIRVKASTTTCPFAQNVFYEYYLATGGAPRRVDFQAWSPAAGHDFEVRCNGTESIVCRTDDGAEARFPSEAVLAYDDEQAATFAASHETRTHPRVDDAVGDNIPNYDEGTGYRVQCADGMYSQSGGRPGACSGHGGVASDGPLEDESDAPDYSSGNEIPNYENGTGYRVQCADGMYSHSGGRPGACSGHGGVG